MLEILVITSLRSLNPLSSERNWLVFSFLPIRMVKGPRPRTENIALRNELATIYDVLWNTVSYRLMAQLVFLLVRMHSIPKDPRMVTWLTRLPTWLAGLSRHVISEVPLDEGIAPYKVSQRLVLSNSAGLSILLVLILKHPW